MSEWNWAVGGAPLILDDSDIPCVVTVQMIIDKLLEADRRHPAWRDGDSPLYPAC